MVKPRRGYYGKVLIGSRSVWRSPRQDSAADARRYAESMAKSYRAKSTHKVRVSVSRTV